VLTLADEADDEGNDRHEGEDEEQNLGNFYGTGSNATEAEYRCDQRDDKKDDCVVQHGVFLLKRYVERVKKGGARTARTSRIELLCLVPWNEVSNFKGSQSIGGLRMRM
jgi:hypothetical protein